MKDDTKGKGVNLGEGNGKTLRESISKQNPDETDINHKRSSKCLAMNQITDSEDVKMDVISGNEVSSSETFTCGMPSNSPEHTGDTAELTAHSTTEQFQSNNDDIAAIKEDIPGQDVDSSPSSTSQETKIQLPKVNCPEKVILCLDLSEEMTGNTFRIGESTRCPAITMVKRIVELFVNNKHEMDKRHEFALVSLHESATWLKNFTREPKDIVNVLGELQTDASDSCNLSSLFDTISEKVQLPNVTNVETVPAPYVVRLILIYGRSLVIPQIEGGLGSLQKLQQSPYFFLDVLYIHDLSTTENKCEEIFSRLCELNVDGTSYVFEIGRHLNKLYNSMAKLLAHPLQRPSQNDLFYKVDYSED